MYHITTEQVETFLTLAQTKNFREASEILFITQPTATKHIQKLEKELGIKLFHRSTQAVMLTEAGSRLANIWSPLYLRFSSAIDEVKYIATKNQNELIISILRDYRPLQTVEILSDLFQDYLQRHNISPISLNFRFYSMREQREALRNHLIDFIFSLGFDCESLHYTESINIAREDIFALLPQDHPLAGKNEISIQELENETIIILSAVESPGVNKVTVSMLQKHLPKVKTETVPNFQSLNYALKYRRGITLGNRHFVSEHDFVEVPITELQNAGYEETLVWNTDNMSVSKMIFLNFVREHLEENIRLTL